MGSGGQDTVSESLTVAHRTPVPTMTYQPLAGSRIGFQFVADAVEQVTSWEWDFGDANLGTGQTPTHTYATDGAYTVTLRARGPGGEGVVTQVIWVNVTTPQVDFISALGGGMYGVELTPRVSGTVDTLEVRFGDGDSTTLTAANPGSPSFAMVPHTYSASGSYAVTMTASGPAGAPSVTRTITVPELPLNPGIAVAQASGVAPLSVAFDGRATGNVQSWAWDFGDGHTASGEDVNHTYRSAGLYTASLTVTGLAGSETELVRIDVSWPPVQALAAASPASGDAPLLVTFSNQSVGHGALSYQWDFGDGQTSSLAEPTHLYQQPGNYSVTLTVTDSAANPQSNSLTIPVTVTALPLEARIEADRLQGPAPLSISLEDDSLGSILGWRWDFGDGTPVFATTDPSLAHTQTHTYTHPGRYTLTLTVSGPLPAPAHEDVATLEVVVTDPNIIPPIARINAVPVIGASPHTIAFTNVSEGTYTSVLWDFGDGNSSTANSVSHTFATGGVYLVRLLLLGPLPHQLPLAVIAEMVSVDVGPEPGLGPPATGSTGGVSAAAITRPGPGSGGSGSSGSLPPVLPGSAVATPGPGWPQASVQRYEPMAGLTFADNYQIVRASPGGPLSTPIQCGQPCGTGQSCGITLDNVGNAGLVSLAVVANDSGNAYVATTEYEVLASQPVRRERFVTTLST